MYIQLKIIGVLFLLLAFLHIFFPKYFNWANELKKISLINHQMMVIHTFFVAFIVFLMGILCLSATTELIETDLGRKITLGLAVFWTARLFVQFFGYSSELWKGKKFETLVHILFSMLWSYFSLFFFSLFMNDL